MRRLADSNQEQGAALAEMGGVLSEVELTQARIEMIVDALFGPGPLKDGSNVADCTVERLQFELNWNRLMDRNLTGAFDQIRKMTEEREAEMRKIRLAGNPRPAKLFVPGS